jgi:[acyl-carrier-protein] S-malonyltransferase
VALHSYVLQARLAVAGAFHTQYMAPAAEKLQEALNNTNIITPRIPVISNVDAQPHSDPATIKSILVKQVGGICVY